MLTVNAFAQRGIDIDKFQLRTLRGHTGKVTDIEFSPDGQTLAVRVQINRTSYIILWDVASGKEKSKWHRVLTSVGRSKKRTSMGMGLSTS